MIHPYPMTDSAPQRADSAAGETGSVVVPVVLSMERKPTVPTLVALFESEEAGLLAFAVGLVKRRWVAEELVQDAFLRLHEVWGEVENPRGWLYRSVRNMALNHLRDHRHEAGLEETRNVSDAAGESRPDEELGRMEAIGMVRLLLADMPPEDRELLRLKGLADGLRHAGIEGSRG